MEENKEKTKVTFIELENPGEHQKNKLYTSFNSIAYRGFLSLLILADILYMLLNFYNKRIDYVIFQLIILIFILSLHDSESQLDRLRVILKKMAINFEHASVSIKGLLQELENKGHIKLTNEKIVNKGKDNL